MLNVHIKEFVSRLRRVWLPFNVWFVLGFVMSLIILRDDPSKSDDPYLLGLVCGTFAASLSVFWLAIDQVWRLLPWFARLEVAYFSGLAIFCLLLWALGSVDGEGAEAFRPASVLSLIIGASTHALLRYQASRVARVTLFTRKRPPKKATKDTDLIWEKRPPKTQTRFGSGIRFHVSTALDAIRGRGQDKGGRNEWHCGVRRKELGSRGR